VHHTGGSEHLDMLCECARLTEKLVADGAQSGMPPWCCQPVIILASQHSNTGLYISHCDQAKKSTSQADLNNELFQSCKYTGLETRSAIKCNMDSVYFGQLKLRSFNCPRQTLPEPKYLPQSQKHLRFAMSEVVHDCNLGLVSYACIV
jgi:hypothetical protein